MTDGAPSGESHSFLHQLQVCKLLQHKDIEVCLEGLDGELEASQFTFQKLPLLDAATPGKLTHEPQLIEVDLNGVQSESVCQHHPLDQGVPTLRQDEKEVADLKDIPKECPCKK